MASARLARGSCGARGLAPRRARRRAMPSLRPALASCPDRARIRSGAGPGRALPPQPDRGLRGPLGSDRLRLGGKVPSDASSASGSRARSRGRAQSSAIPHAAQRAPERLPAERDAELVPQPPRETGEPPAHDAVQAGPRPRPHRLRERGALLGRRPRRLARCLARCLARRVAVGKAPRALGPRRRSAPPSRARSEGRRRRSARPASASRRHGSRPAREAAACAPHPGSVVSAAAARPPHGPPRVCRRRFRLSYAASFMASTCAWKAASASAGGTCPIGPSRRR